MLYGGSIPPGHFQGNDVTIQDVFEAIGAHAAGQDDRRGARRARGGREPRRRRLRRPVHRQHDGDGLRDARHLADGPSDLVPAQDPTKAEVAYEAGKLVMDVLKRGQRPSDIITREALENAIAAVAAARRLDQRRPAPARGRPRGRRRARHRRLRPHRRAHAAAVRPQARRPLRRRRPATRPAASAVVLKRLQEAGLLNEDAITVTGQHDRRARRRGRRDRGPARRPPARRPDQGDRRPRDPARQPRARGLRRQARRPRAPSTTRARRASSRARRRRWPPSRTGQIKAGDVVVIRNEGPAGGPGMREMLAVTGAHRRRRGSATTSRCSPTGASPAPRTASWSATSPPRRSRGGPIAAVRDGDTITIDVDTRRIDVDAPRRRDRPPRRGLRAARERGPHRRAGQVRRSSSAAPPRARSRADAARTCATRRGPRRRSPRKAPRSRPARNSSSSALKRRALEHRHVAGVLPDDLARVRGSGAANSSASRDRDELVARSPTRSASGRRSRRRRSRIG